MFVTPAVAGEHVYVGSCAGSFYAFDRSTGEVAWSYGTRQDGSPAQFHGDVVVTDEKLTGSETPSTLGDLC